MHNPEIVTACEGYKAGADGWTKTLEVLPKEACGGADVVRHRQEQLDKAVRWCVVDESQVKNT